MRVIFNPLRNLLTLRINDLQSTDFADERRLKAGRIVEEI